MATTKASGDKVNDADLPYEHGVFETPIAVRFARIFMGSALSILSVSLIVFLFTSSQDRAMDRLEQEFLAAAEAQANAVPSEIALQDKYSIEDDDLISVLPDIARFDETISANINIEGLSDIQVTDNRVVFISDDIRYFYEANSVTAMDYINEYIDSELRGLIQQ